MFCAHFSMDILRGAMKIKVNPLNILRWLGNIVLSEGNKNETREYKRLSFLCTLLFSHDMVIEYEICAFECIYEKFSLK